MKTSTKVAIAISGILFGAIAAEQMFLSRLQDSVIHDDARLDAFLKSLHYPIWVEPGFGFCRPGGVSWGYKYQLCVHYGATSKECPIPSFIIQYLGPQGRLSVISNQYYDEELVFRHPIYAVNNAGEICFDMREGS